MNINNFMDCSGHYEDAHYWENDIQDNKNIFYLNLVRTDMKNMRGGDLIDFLNFSYL